MNRSLSLAGLAVAAVLGAGRAAAHDFEYRGVCEASAAARLDGRHFAVASDETETLTLYERGRATPVGSVEHANVTDIEASARIGDVIFWQTSHSLNREGQDKPKRKLLFATTVAPGSSPALVPAGVEFRNLRSMIAPALGLDEAALMPTLNIEGLAATPEGDLLIGLRAPLSADGRAQLVRIRDPLALVGLGPAGVQARAEAVPPLDLQGRGIRSIELVGTGAHRYLIVAGPVLDRASPPLLFWWDGAGAATPGPAALLGGMTPEALVAWSDRDIQIIGDNGDSCSDESANPRWFPSIDVRP